MTDLTSNEKGLLKEFAYCEMTSVNGSPKHAESADELDTYVWLDEREVNGLSVPALKGVLGSLVKKEMVHVHSDYDYDYLAFTDKGFEAVKELI